MSVDKETVRRVAKLARLALKDEELEPMAGEINAILTFVAQLSTIDVAGIEPMTSVLPMALPRREDNVTDGYIPDKILANAIREDGFFVVPKVVE
jgi:aspartyl-tRNA(Asn)/glutamyl-tRNA(Gln) amidotransferase subunit C